MFRIQGMIGREHRYHYQRIPGANQEHCELVFPQTGNRTLRAQALMAL